MSFRKYLVNITEMIITGKKVPIQFVVTEDEIQVYKFITLIATICFLIVKITL